MTFSRKYIESVIQLNHSNWQFARFFHLNLIILNVSLRKEDIRINPPKLNFE